MNDVVVIAGAGPGNGAAFARRFAQGSYPVALLARTERTVQALADELRAGGGTALGLAVDLTDPDAVAHAFRRIRRELGAVGMLIQNAAFMVRGAFLDVPPDAFRQGFELNVMSTVHCCRESLPEMVARGGGVVVLIGATGSLRGGAGFAAFAAGKFGLRALGQSLAREFGPQGVHVAHVVIDGVIDNPRSRARLPVQPEASFLQPAHIAETVWHLVHQPRSAWSHEVDLRPFAEKW
jgi:NAD(P)-dependent dehydrogenase (short-subunit alcohol dehydrogenase family)